MIPKHPRTLGRLGIGSFDKFDWYMHGMSSTLAIFRTSEGVIMCPYSQITVVEHLMTA